jgi:hypothetical protein
MLRIRVFWPDIPMIYFIFAVIFLAIALFGHRFIFPTRLSSWAHFPLRCLAGLLALFCVLETSVVSVPADKVGIVRRIYGFHNLPDGHIIGTNQETGYQAIIVPPGTWRVSLGFNLYNDVGIMPVVQVPQGFYGRIVARDGEPLAEGQIMADAWPDEHFADMLDAQYFMTHGGRRGLQLSVLKPGTYPINLKLYQVRIGRQPNTKDNKSSTDMIFDEAGYHEEDTPLDTSITRVPAGFVGVVRSSVQSQDAHCTVEKVKVDSTTTTATAPSSINESLSADLVPQNCKGIWSYALPPNDYYLNRDAYEVTLVDTRVQTLEFKGGFQRRWIDLTVNAKGDFDQKERRAEVPPAPDAADDAVNTKAEGWEIPQELRVVLQISPKNAPVIVAAVGGLKEVEKRITVPSVRAHVRNVFGGTITVTEPEVMPPEPMLGSDGHPLIGPDGKPLMAAARPKLDANGRMVMHQITRPTKVLDTVEQRTALEDEILARVAADGAKAGIDVKEIRLGESVIPPELLLARQRQQLAEQLRAAFVQEQQAQTQRQEVEKARATADKQGDLVKAQIGVQTADLGQRQKELEGQGERKYLEQIAQGQQAQTNVLGAEKVFMGNVITQITTMLNQHPEIANQKWPLFIGGGAWENVAGMLTQSHLVPATPPLNQAATQR